MARPIVVLGADSASGSYLLRIHIAQPVDVVFGRFNRAQPIAVPAGDAVYVGSALGGRLGSRLMRHATRSDGSGQAIRPMLQTTLRSHGVYASAPSTKRLHWHIDYLLDHPAATLTGVIAVRDTRRLEGRLASMLQADPQTRPVAPGLGGSDTGAAHLFHMVDAGIGWQTLSRRVARLLAIASPASAEAGIVGDTP